MSVVRCDSCQGRKTLMGMGGMRKDCAACHGVGWVKPKTDKSEVKVEKVKIVRKKRAPNKVKDKASVEKVRAEHGND